MKKSNDLSVRLFGGLGNQLFQYFAGLDLSLKAGSRLKVDARWIEASYSQDESDIRDFRFLIDTAIITENESGEINFKLERLKTKFASKSQAAAKFFSLNVPNNPGFVEIDNLEPGVELRGYFQSYKYFENVNKNVTVQDWSLKNEPQLFLETRRELDSTPFIAIHVRGGDYLNRTNIYHKLESKYYLESLENLRSVIGNMKAIVFSDDVAYAKNLFDSDAGLEFLSQDGLRASEAMILISLAKGIIIANSTFSYWAAMINSGQHIIAPKFWYANKLVDKDLYPPRWTII
jgi:hypothetical protein